PESTPTRRSTSSGAKRLLLDVPEARDERVGALEKARLLVFDQLGARRRFFAADLADDLAELDAELRDLSHGLARARGLDRVRNDVGGAALVERCELRRRNVRMGTRVRGEELCGHAGAQLDGFHEWREDTEGVLRGVLVDEHDVAHGRRLARGSELLLDRCTE